MNIVKRWLVWLGVTLGITLLLWLVALATSIIPTVLTLGTSVHGLSLADYGVTPVRRLAPLSNQILQDVQRDRAATTPSPSPSPQPSPSATPSRAPSPTPVPTLPTPTPTMPPLPTPTLPPLPTPTLPPLPTPTLPPLP
jgi:hypothetical protein